jgi:aminoglycoside 2''-phosphotransferase
MDNADDVPWRSDRELDATIVRGVLAEQFPQLDVADVAYLHAGWDSDAYDVTTRDGARWVFRFPKRAHVQAWLATERRLLPELGPTLPLPIPRFAFEGRPSPRFPFEFVGYRKIDGTPGGRLDASAIATPRVAAELGSFLSALHAFPVARARELRVPVCAPTLHRDRLAEVVAVEPRLRHRLPAAVRDRCASFLAGRPAPPVVRASDLRLSHADLGVEHVVFDPATYEVRGIIDWGDVRVADPAGDFAGLWLAFGDAFVTHLLRHYAHPVDERALARMRFQGRCAALVWLAYAGDDQVDPARRKVAELFAGPS